MCIDSDCIIDFLKGKREAIEIVDKHKEELVTTEINIFEILFGIYKNKVINKTEEETAKSFFDSIDILSKNGWGIKAAEIFSDMMKQGNVIEQNDCLIASIMLVNGCNKIITQNTKHFSKIKEIDVTSY